MRLCRWTVAPVLAAVLGACAEPRVPAASADTTGTMDDPRVMRRDSAGVELVTTREPTWEAAEAWRLVPEPAVMVTAGALGVERIAGVTRLASGALAAADGRRGVIVVFDSGGTVVRTHGGPQMARPFRQLFWVAARGDTVLGYDLADHRLVRFPPSGVPAAVELRSVAASSFTPLRPLGLFAGGSIAAASGGGAFPFEGDEYSVRRDSALLLRYAPSGRVSDTLGTVPWGESMGVAEARGRRRLLVPLPRPYGLATTAVAAGERLYVGTGERYEIAVHDTAGRLVRVFGIPLVPDSLTPAAVDSFRVRARRRAAAADSSSPEWLLAQAMERAPFPSHVPAYERFLVDPDGAVWVLDAAPVTREAVTWRIFAPDGGYLGIVPMPARLVVHEIGRDYVLGVWTDDEGGQSVRLHRIERGAAGQSG